MKVDHQSHSLIKVLTTAGVSLMDENTLKFFSELYEAHFVFLAKLVAETANHNNRSKPTWKDLLIVDQVQSLTELANYFKQSVELADVTESTVTTPAATPKITKLQVTSTASDSQTFNEDPLGVIAKKRIPVSEHMPPFPPAHSYMQTKIPLHPQTEDLEWRKKRINQETVMENNLKDLLLRSFKIPGTYRPLVETDYGLVDYTLEKI